MGEYYIAHYGVKGMKWGVRRYQNADGSYTSAGRARRARDISENKGKKEKNRVDVDSPNAAKRWVREDQERTKAVLDRSADAARSVSRGVDAYSNLRKDVKQRPRQDLSKYSDQELREAVNRELLERQYNQIFNSPQERTGEKKVKDVMEMTAAGLSIVSTGLGIALAVKKLKG